MKNTLLLFALLAFSLAGFSQIITDEGRCMPKDYKPSGLTQVMDEIGDFTIVDSEGFTHNLYDILDEGNTVLIDLFFTS